MPVAVAPEAPPQAERDRELTRVRRLASEVLKAYDLERPRLRLLEHKKNATFRVDEDVDEAVPLRRRRYVLRVGETGRGGHDEIALRSEMQYLEALTRATGLLVPEPVTTIDGRRVVREESPEGGESRLCALFRWVPGRMVRDDPTTERMEKVGALLAEIHRFSETFEPPEGFSRPRWDADALFGVGQVLEPGRGEPLVTARGRELLEAAARIIRQDMDALGGSRDVFGMIHKDLEPDNTLIDGDAVHAIDFADCGWGHYLYDVASSLLPLREKAGFPEMRKAFLRGYTRRRPLAPEHVDLVDTFLVARSIFACRLMLGKLWDLEHIREYAQSAIPQILGGVRRFLEERDDASARKATRTTVRFLGHLRSLDVQLWAEGERLRFKAPRGVMTPEIVDELKGRKAEILAFLQRGAASAGAGPTDIPRIEGNRAPLSFAQQRLWFIHRMAPESAVYNIARALRLRGPVRVAVLRHGLTEIARRHEALRTTFVEEDGRPLQTVEPARPLGLPVVDLAGLSPDRREPEARRLALTEARRPFDLERGSLLRVRLLRIDGTDHVAPSTMHHIVGDGWSSALLFRELGDLYRTFAEGRPSHLPELPIQYKDFAHWQREWLTGEILEEQLTYWRDALDGAPQLLELPTDRPRIAAASARGSREKLLIPRPLAETLKSFAQTRGATLFMILLAAFQALLHRHSGQDDVVVGSPIANRNRGEIEGLIGFFANTLVLRSRPEPRLRFRDLLEQVRQTTLGAYAHQDLPFERIVEELRPERSVSDTPLFQVVMTLQNVPYPDMQVSDFRMTLMPPTSRVTPFDLALNMKEMPEGIRTSWNFRHALFDAATIRRLSAQYLRLLDGAMEDPDLELRELPLVSPGERHQLLHESNDTDATLPDGSLAELFAAWVRRAPDAPAVVTDAATWSYERLGRHARGLARALRANGVEAGDLVGISSRRSPEMIAGLLAVVGVGAAYVPLDPEYPQDRLRFMVEETGLQTVLVSEAMTSRIEDAAPVPQIRLDQASEVDQVQNVGAGGAGGNVEVRTSPDHLAYVLYTSGSTGRPKGTAVPQRAVIRLVRNTNWIDLGPGDRTAHMSNTSFDAATFEIWGALLNGAALVVLDRESILSPPAFVDRLRRHQVGAMFVTVSLFNQVVREIPDAFRTVGCVLFGGEAADPASVWRCLEAGPPERLLNGYGPTEATTFACTHRTDHVADDARTIPIGRPIANTSVHVLDRSGGLVPLGVAGELFIGGPGLGWGYLRQPGRTAERFVPEAFADPGRRGGERLYRTGDRVRRRPSDGAVEFLGRFDDQVKIRGFRIEPGEIAVALEAHPSVADAAVKVWEVDTAERRLAAYVVTRGQDVDAEALRDFLRDRLPDFMVPKRIVFPEAMPLTANGKLDRAALPEPDWGSADEDVRLPGTPTETLVADVWKDVLNLDAVDVDRDFFELGGHSLLATRVLSRIREIFEVELPLQTLFDATTVEDLARTVDEALRGDRGPDEVPLEPVDRSGELPLSFAQQRLWFLDQLEPSGAVYNVPAVLDLAGTVRGGRLAQVLTEVVRRQEALRTSFPEHEGRPRQAIRDPAPVALRRVDLTGVSGSRREAEARRLAAQTARRAFDLATGPTARFVLLRTDARRHVLGLVLHHIVSDGWSMGILMREVAALEPAFRDGRPSPLEELPIRYADFAAWQREWLSQGVHDRELTYWKDRLAGAPAVLELPTDRPRPAAETFRGRSRRVELEPETARAAGELARREGATLYMVLLAAFQVLLARWTGRHDVVVGSPIAGRPRRELEDLIGFFVNTLVLRTRLDGTSSFRELLGRVRETALGAYAHQSLPFEHLVEALAPRRDLAHSPLFQVMFVLQNAPLDRVELQDLTFSRFPVTGDTSMFDLTLSLSESSSETGRPGLGGTLTYNRDLFDATTMGRFVRHFGRLLQAAVNDPDRAPAELPWASAAERHQLLREHDDSPALRWSPASATIPGDFEARARRAPEAPALVHGDRRWSYAELNRRADRLARRLVESGVRPEDRVGVCLHRSPGLVATLLGIWKAGGAYVPLDPGYPRERLAFMVEDAGIGVLVAEESTRTVLPDAGVQVLELADPAPEPAGDEPSATPLPAPDPDRLAYVIYTSGSTGRPKGVAIEHRSAAALTAWAHDEISPDDWTGVLACTSINFDLSVFELFAPLTCGGRVILVADALELVDLPARDEVRLVNTVPSALVELLRLGGLPSSVATVHLAGEPLRRSLVDALYATGHVNTVRNLYGPSEDTTYSTGARVEPGSGEPTIGRPLPGTRGHVLDRWMRLTPPGVPGELVLEGEGLARGYLGRPARTARAWAPNPFGVPGSRLYRTGDRVRRRADGELEFLGRFDHQVKLRGYRIELGEIEAALLARPGVRDAVVTVTAATDGSGPGPRLTAYAEIDRDAPGKAPSAEDLRRGLGATLPEYMIPSAFVLVPELPRTPNGKVDRRALPEPGRPESSPTAPTEPRSPEEELVASVWAEVLGLERVGVHDDFFASGGHSLLATRVVARVRRAFDVELPLTRLFESPTVAGLARAVEAARRAGRDSSIPPLEPLAATRSTDPLPLSFAQERLWFFESLDPARPAYNLPAAIRLRGDVRAEQVQHDFREVVRRHHVLRTCYPAPDGTPRQEILGDPAVALPRVDLSSLGGRDRREQARRLARAEGVRPFDLTRQIPLRLTLLRLGDDEHLLLSTFHHIASDAWSTARLLEELSALHEAFGAGRPSPLMELPLQYADFAVWQRSWLRGDVLEAEIAHARRRLEGAPEVLDLPTDRPRPATPSYRVGTRHGELSPELRAGLGELVRAAGVTPFMVLLAAFQILLGRWTGRRDVLVGSPVAGRPAEAESLIGFFVNTLVLRSRLHDEQSFEEHLGAVRRDALDAYDHQALPFERLVDELAPRRDLSRPPLVQALLVFQNAPRRTPDSRSLRFEPVGRTRPEGAVFDLTLVLEETSDGGLSTALHFARDLFDETTAERFLRHFRTLLRSVVADPRRAPAEQALWNPEERHQVLVEWNDAPAPSRGADTVLEILDRHVRRRPDAVAVVGDGEHLTYGELQARSRRVARVLRGRGVRTEEPVGLAVGRSPERVVGLVGILRSGGAFLPLDPDYPPGRLLHMVRDAGVRTLVADSRGAAVLDETNLPVVPPSPASPEGPPDPVPPTVAPDRLAYLIYTSGSTGRPKGVAVPHRGLAHVVAAQREAFGVDPESRVLQFSTPGFDASVFETVMALGSGATLCLGTPAAATPGEPLTNLLRRQQVTVVTLTPSTLGLLPGPSTLPALATVTVAGEACPRELVDRWAPGRRFFNLYGPTETTIWATTAPCPLGEAGRPSIGRPVPHASAMVLDRTGRPVPLGVRGELVVTGDGVTRGYLGQPARTARSFVPDAVTGRSGARSYRTGDVARWRSDGRLDFLGRVDRQVQVRGVRVEPGEVEAALTALPEIAEAVVVLHGERSAAARLLAYVVADDGWEIEAEALRSALRDRLPEVMIPSIFVAMDGLPRMPSGKVDRNALPAPEHSRSASEAVAPRTPLERELAAIWRDVLGGGPIGVRDDFFELGGQSLLAVRLAARLRRRFGRDIPVSEFFGRMTVERLAARLAADDRDGAAEMDPASPVVTLRSGAGTPLVLAHPAGGEVGRYVPLVERLGGSFPVLGLRAPAAGDDAGVAEAGTLEEQVSRYVGALRETVPEGPYRLAGWSTGGVVAFETARQLVADGHAVDLLALLDTQSPGSARQRLETVDETTLVRLFARDVLQVPIPETAAGSDPQGDPLERLGDEVQIEPAVLRERFARFRRQLELLDAYEPDKYPGRIDLVWADPPPPGADDPRRRWQHVATGPVETHLVAASHLGLLRGDAAGCVARILSTRIDTLDENA